MAEQDVVYSWIQIQTADGATYPFAIDPDSYIKRDIIDFAPRSGGGDVAYSNLDLYQLVTQDSWHHGLGFVQFRDKFGYRITSDGVDTRHVSVALMFTKYTSDYNYAGNSFINSVDFGGATYFSMGAGGVWKRTTGGTWSKVLTATVGKIMTNGSYLIVALPAGRTKTSSNGTSWSDAGVSGNPPNNFNHLDIHNGFMWGSESGVTAIRTLTGTSTNTGTYDAGRMATITGSGTKFTGELNLEDYIKIGSTLMGRVKAILSDTILHVILGTTATLSGGEAIYNITPGPSYDCVHFWSGADSSDAEGGGIADVGAIVVGIGSPTIKGLASFNNMLHISRPDGVWAVDDTITPPLARRVLSFPDEQHSSNFAIFLPWRGRLYFNVKNAIYAYNGSSLANVTPPTYDLNYPPAAFGGFIGATYRGPYLYVLAADNQSPANYYLLAFDGTGWFLLLNLGTTVPTGIGYSALTDNLFIGITGGETWRIPFQAKSELPYASFENNVNVTVTDSAPSIGGSTPNFTLALNTHVVPDSVRIDYYLQRPSHNATDNVSGTLTNELAQTVGSVNYGTGLVSLNISDLDVAYGTLVCYQYYNYTIVTDDLVGAGGSNPNYTAQLHTNVKPGTIVIDYSYDPLGFRSICDDGNGLITECGYSDQLGVVNYSTGLVSWFEPNTIMGSLTVCYQWYTINTVNNAVPTITGSSPNYSFNTHADLVADSVMWDYHATRPARYATDDTLGNLTDNFGAGTGTVNYNTGVVSFYVPSLDVPSGVLVDYVYTLVAKDHHLYLSEIDFGFRRVIKSFAEIDLEVYNVTVDRYVAVGYSADGSAWQRLGQVVANGVTKLNMIPTVEAYKLDVRLNFQTGDTTQSPVLRNVTIKAMIRPDSLYGHQFVVIGSNEIRMLDSRFNPGSSEQQKQWIEAVRSSKAPVTFVDPFGISHSGYISTAQFIDIKRRPGESQSNWQCRINLVEVR